MTHTVQKNSAGDGPFAEPSLLDAILRRLREARAVQVIGHTNPDGDCIGSLLAVHHLLEEFGVRHALAAPRIAVTNYDQMEGFALLRETPDPDLHPDLIVYLDCATLERGPEWKPPAPILNIDHHASNTRFGEVNWIDPASAATGEMVYRLFRHARVALTRPVAEALLIAISTDTGSFRFGNTGAVQHRIAAELIDAGASPACVSRVAYDSNTLESMRMTGHVMSTMRIAADGRLAWSELRADDYRRLGGWDKAPENLASALRRVRGVRVAVLFHEQEDGSMRINFRSDGQFDVGRFAARWGGGGHTPAAGLTLPPGPFESRRTEIVELLETELAPSPDPTI